MKSLLALAALAVLAAPVGAAARVDGQNPTPERIATRESLRALLEKEGSRSDVSTIFRQSAKQEFNFTGTMTAGLKHAEQLEIVITVTANDTISFRVYPHYKGAYINTEHARDRGGLMRRLLNLSDRNFLFWGADDTNDVFAGYTFTLESGFPYDSIVMVLRSIRNTDQFVGELKPFIDG